MASKTQEPSVNTPLVLSGEAFAANSIGHPFSKRFWYGVFYIWGIRCLVCSMMLRVQIGVLPTACLGSVIGALG